MFSVVFWQMSISCYNKRKNFILCPAESSDQGLMVKEILTQNGLKT